MTGKETTGSMKSIQNNGFRWIDVSRPARDDMKELSLQFAFHELNLGDFLSKIQIPKIDRYESHLFIILHFPTMAAQELPIPRPSQLAVFMGSGYLVTVHQGDLKPVVDMFQLCTQDSKAREELMGDTCFTA